MRFRTRTPSASGFIHLPFAPTRCSISLAALVLAVLSLGQPHPAIGADFDLALHVSDQPYGEAAIATELGGVALSVRHVEYFDDLSHTQDENAESEADPLLRSSRVEGRRRFALGDSAGAGFDVSMPLGFSMVLDERQSGYQELRVTAESGVDLPGLHLAHSFTVTDSFATDGSEARHSVGRLNLGFDFLGGTQEGFVEYDAMPLTQVTMVGARSEWTLDARTSTEVALTHRPLEGISEARVGLRQPFGPFDLTSDVAADSLGGYAVGLTLALPLGQTPEASTWSLADLLAAFAAARQPRGWTPGPPDSFGSN